MDLSALYEEYEDKNAVLNPFQGSETSSDLSAYITELGTLQSKITARIHVATQAFNEAVVRENGDPLQVIAECEAADTPDFDINTKTYADRVIFRVGAGNLGRYPQRSVLLIRFAWQPTARRWNAPATESGQLSVIITSDLPRRHQSSAYGKFESKAEAVAGFDKIYRRALKNFKKGYTP